MKHIFVLLAFLISASSYAAGNGTTACAIRWDAQAAGPTSAGGSAIARTTGPAKWQFRAPFFAVPNSQFDITINGNQQSVMDQELTYASNGGLKCWLYLWYGETNSMQNSWYLHQSSTLANSVKWAQMQQLSNIQKNGTSSFTSYQATLLSYFQKSNYQYVTVSGVSRPVWAIYTGGSAITNYGYTSWADFGTTLSAFRTYVQNAGVANPYVVLMDTSTNAAAAGADAIADYVTATATQVAGGSGWAAELSTVEGYWATRLAQAVAASVQYVPTALTGWDTRPRKDNVVTYATAGSAHKNFGTNVYGAWPCTTGTTCAAETSHFQDAVSYVVNNAPNTPPLWFIYAWDECDEGGNCLEPQYNAANPSAPNMMSINSFAAVTQ